MLYVANKSAEIEIDDQSFVLQKGKTALTAGHPLVKARPELFEEKGEPSPADAEEPPKERSGARVDEVAARVAATPGRPFIKASTARRDRSVEVDTPARACSSSSALVS